MDTGKVNVTESAYFGIFFVFCACKKITWVGGFSLPDRHRANEGTKSRETLGVTAGRGWMGITVGSWETQELPENR